MERQVGFLWTVDINKALFGTEEEKTAMRLQMIILMGIIGEALDIRLEGTPKYTDYDDIIDQIFANYATET